MFSKKYSFISTVERSLIRTLLILPIRRLVMAVKLQVELTPLLYARSETSDVLWYGVRPSVRPSVRPLAKSCPLNILKCL